MHLYPRYPHVRLDPTMQGLLSLLLTYWLDPDGAWKLGLQGQSVHEDGSELRRVIRLGSGT